jgi:GTP-dependent phosphoenolpyruvate carboxykinase
MSGQLGGRWYKPLPSFPADWKHGIFLVVTLLTANMATSTDTTSPAEDEAFDPIGTLVLIGIYFGILVAMWIFMYFVEFLGNDLTVIG